MNDNYVSKLAQNFPVSGIRFMFELAADYPCAINLCNGEPNFATPAHLRESCRKAIEAGMTQYGTEPGLTAFREAVAHKYTREIGCDYDIDNVMATIGSVEGILLSLLTILNPGDEVIIPDPAYTCYEGQVLIPGGVPVRVPLYEGNGFLLQPEDLEKAITPKTKAIILCYPSNPLGTVLTKENGEKLADIIEKHNLIVLSDEVYEKILFDGRTHFSLAQIPRIRDKVLVINSLSKTYAMTGWRVGYVVGTNKDILKNMYKMQQPIASSLPLFIMQVGADALNGPQDCVEEMRKDYERRRDLLAGKLSEIPRIKAFKTEGAFYTFMNIKDFGMTSWELSKDLLIHTGVMTVAGSAFGAMGEGYLRMSFTNSDENISAALDKIKNYLNHL